jgi:hypothetical protein
MLVAPGLRVVLDLGQDLHPALDMCDRRAPATLHRLLMVSRNGFWVKELLPRDMQIKSNISDTRRLLVSLHVRVVGQEY